MMYSANPKRTPVFVQAILQNTPIIFCAMFRFLIIKRKLFYKHVYIILSLLCICIAIAMIVLPLGLNSESNQFQFWWILIILAGVIFQALYNVIQEKYFEKSTDFSIHNKINVVFWCKLFELLTIISLSWLELYIGYNNHPIKSFIDSVHLYLPVSYILLYYNFLLLLIFLHISYLCILIQYHQIII